MRRWSINVFWGFLMFVGYVALSSAVRGTHVTKNSSSVPTNADSTPTFRVYGPSGTLMTNGTGSLTQKDTGSITGATNATPIVITSTNHKLSTGNRVTITGVQGNTAANGTFNVTVLTANTFSLDSSVGNGSYTSGGSWNLSGVYDFSITPTAANGYASGSTYLVLVTDIVSSVTKVGTYRFTVT